MSTKSEMLKRQEAKLLKQLEENKAEQARLANLPPDAILDNLFNDKDTRGIVTQKVYDLTGGDRNRTASILRTSVAEVHNAMNACSGGQNPPASSNEAFGVHSEHALAEDEDAPEYPEDEDDQEYPQEDDLDDENPDEIAERQRAEEEAAERNFEKTVKAIERGDLKL